MKTTKLALTLVIALVLMITTALAATLLFSPRYEALRLSDQVLLEKYGITEEMQPGLTHTLAEADGKTVVTYEVVESEIMKENRFGTYTVTIVNGVANVTWSMDGMETAGGLDAPAWGAEQLLMYVREYGKVMNYMVVQGMLQNAPMVTPAPTGTADKWEQSRQATLSMAKITQDEAVVIGLDALAERYRLTAYQAEMLVHFSGIEDESTYEIVSGRPLVSLFFHLTQNPGEWTEKDGIYVVTINLLDGAVEDIIYDNGLMGNG